MAEDKALRLLGLAARAGRVTVGSPLTCEALKRSGRPCAVLLASDASANTAKRITDRTDYYNVPLFRLTVDGESLAVTVGKRGAGVAVVGITEPSLAAAVCRELTAQKEN